MAKNVVITGATSGIGEAIARAYLEKGENIVLTGRRTERLEALKTEFAEAFPNQKVWTFPLDVTDMSMVKTVCSDILKTVGKIDILVNNAGLALGLAPYQDYEELDMLTMLGYQCQGLDGCYSLSLAFYGDCKSRPYHKYGFNRRYLRLRWCSSLFSNQGCSQDLFGWTTD